MSLLRFIGKLKACRYFLADGLTFMRFVLALIVPLFVMQRQLKVALVLFAIAALTDALDGWCARRWPYPSSLEKRLFWRKLDAHQLDNVPDGLMVSLTAIAMTFVISWWWIMLALIFGVSIVFWVAVRVFVFQGWPIAAERTDVLYGLWFASNIAMVVVGLLVQAELWSYESAALLAMICVPILIMKWDRATTRPETRQEAMRRREAREPRNRF